MSGRSKVLAPVLTVVAVVAVAATASLVGGPGTAKPRVLHLAGDGSAETRDTALSAPLSARAASGDYQLVGTLPGGKPADAPAWTLAGGPGGAGPVAALAKALGAPTPTKDPDGWSAGGLRVSAETGRAWWWSPCAVATDLPLPAGPDTAVSSTQGDPAASPSVGIVACASYAFSGGGSTSSGGSVGSGVAATAVPDAPPPAPTQIAPAPPLEAPVPRPALSPPVPCPPDTGAQTLVACEPLPGRTPTSAEVFAAAGDLLTAVGLDETGHVTTYPGGGTVTVDPTVGGLPTTGWSTQVDLTVTGNSLEITSAHGWLAPASRGDTYPLISAQAAYDALPAMPRMMMACPLPSPGSGAESSCPEPAPQRITGAHLGLALTWLQDQQVALLPAWLFDVQGSDQRVPSVAVEPAYLDDGSTGPTDSTTTDPGTIEPAPDGYVPPPVEQAGPSEGITVTHWRPSTADNAVTVLYDNGGCGRTGVVADVKEDGTQVYVFLRADVPPPNQVCTADLRPASYEVALQNALGDRKVIDGLSGRPVPRA